MKTILRAAFGLLMALVTVWSFTIPPAAKFMNPQLARIFVWHFPCPMIATVMLLLGAWFSVRQLQTKDREWDLRAEAAHELSYLFSLLTMVTGMLFSKVQWGAWWQWDPRQTSFLIVLLIYAAYFTLRSAFPDPDRRAANAAAYALAALLPALFLIFVFPRLPQVQSFHPSDSIMKGQIKGEYGTVVMATMTLLSLLTAWCYRLRIRAGKFELLLENTNDQLASDRIDSAPTGVVRPLRLPSSD